MGLLERVTQLLEPVEGIALYSSGQVSLSLAVCRVTTPPASLFLSLPLALATTAAAAAAAAALDESNTRITG